MKYFAAAFAALAVQFAPASSHALSRFPEVTVTRTTAVDAGWYEDTYRATIDSSGSDPWYITYFAVGTTKGSFVYDAPSLGWWFDWNTALNYVENPTDRDFCHDLGGCHPHVVSSELPPLDEIFGGGFDIRYVGYAYNLDASPTHHTPVGPNSSALAIVDAGFSANSTLGIHYLIAAERLGSGGVVLDRAYFTSSHGVIASAVPLPATAPLAVAAMAGLVAFRAARGRRRS